MRKTPIQEVIKDIDLITSMWNDPGSEMDFNHTMEVFRSRCIEKLEDEKKFTEKWFDRGMNWKKSPINFEQSWNELHNTKDSTGNQAREYTSPLIEELLNEVTSEEVERANKQMKLTSIDWLMNELAESGLLVTKDIDNLVAYNKAKTIHQVEIWNAYSSGADDELEYHIGGTLSREDINCEKYYNKTFNTKEK